MLLFLLSVNSATVSKLEQRYKLFLDADLVGMQLVFTDQLADRFYFFGRFQRHFEREFGLIPSSFSGHSLPPQAAIIILQSTLACGPVFGVHYKAVPI